jgi:hypothetical protein
MHMSEAPRDGTRILIQNQVMHFVAYGQPYERDGTEIVEGYYDKTDSCWRQWVGNPHVKANAKLIPLAWWPKPEDVQDDGPTITRKVPRRRSRPVCDGA